MVKKSQKRPGEPQPAPLRGKKLVVWRIVWSLIALFDLGILKYDAARTLTAFSATLQNEVDLAQLQKQLVRVVAETMLPTHVSLWLFQVKKNNGNITTLEEQHL